MRIQTRTVALALGLVSLLACESRSPATEVIARKQGGGGLLVPTEPELPLFVGDGIGSPTRAVLTPEGRLLVTDARLRMILRVDPASLQPDQGLQLRTKPTAVGLLGARIYVGSPDQQTVEIFAARGGRALGNFGVGAVGYAMAIAVEPTRQLVYVLDGQSRQVKVFSAAGGLVSSFGGPGPDVSQFLTPTGIAVDTARQEILVSDYGSPPTVKAAVKIFGYDGVYKDVISGAGKCGMISCSGGFSRPQGLGVTVAGRIFLTDAVLGQVLVYDRATKALLRTVGSYPMLHLPVDAVIGRQGDLFVVSNLTSRIVRFAGEAAQ